MEIINDFNLSHNLPLNYYMFIIALKYTNKMSYGPTKVCRLKISK
jgi:hypothetical protein